MQESIKDCKCIDRDDKLELSKAILSRMAIYQDSIARVEIEEIIEKAKILKKGEVEIKPTREIEQYKEILNRLDNLYKRLENTPACQ